MIKIESVVAKLLLVLSAIFAVIMIKYSFGMAENTMDTISETVSTAIPVKKYYIPALRRNY